MEQKSFCFSGEQRECNLCGFQHERKNPCIWGEGKIRSIMLVGQNPGKKEDEEGKVFVGKTGRLLLRILTKEQKKKCYFTNIVKCYIRGKTPTKEMISNCLPYLIEEVRQVQPKVIVTLGEIPTKALLGKEKIRDISFTGQTSHIPELAGIPIFATYNPAAAFRKGEDLSIGPGIAIYAHIHRTMDVAFKVAFRKERREANYRIISSEKELKAFLKSHDKIAIDIETSSLDEFEGKIKSIALSVGYETVVMEWKDWVKGPLGEFLFNEENTIIGATVKFDLRWLAKEFGVDDFPCKIEDIAVLDSLITDEFSHSLDSMTFRYLPEYAGYKADLAAGDPSSLEGEKLLEYNATDAEVTYKIFIKLKKQTSVEGMYYCPYQKILIPATHALLSMERKGIPADRDFLISVKNNLQRKLDDLIRKIRKDDIVKERFPDGDFNPFSHLHMKRLTEGLFNEDELPKTKKGNPSYGKDFIAKFQDEFPLLKDIERVRVVQKVITDIEDNYLPAIKEDGRIHPHYTLFIAKSGRTSVKDPNCQNIPRTDVEGERIRNFVYAPKGWLLLSADYSQHELRVAAALSKDKAMIKMLNEGVDIHSTVAARIEGISYEEFKKRYEAGDPEIAEKRSMAKSVVFGTIYGMTAHGLARRLKISVRKAERYIEAFFHQFPRLRAWCEMQKRIGETKREIRMPFNRKRKFTFEHEVTRKAINYPVQGGASDLLLLSLGRIHKKLKEEKLLSHPILEVHDEILFLVKEEELDIVTEMITYIMTHPDAEWLGEVQLKVDVNVGERWGDLK